MWTRHAIVLFSLLGLASTARAQDFRIEEKSSPKSWNLAELKPGMIAFDDRAAAGADSKTSLVTFADWASKHATQKKFLGLFPSYTEPVETATDKDGPVNGKLYMYVAQARFVLDRAPDAIDLSRDVTLHFLERIDPAIKHTLITAADVAPFKNDTGTANDNPDRKWCTGRSTSICIKSSYKLEGRIPIGVMLVNKLRDSAKKISDHMEFESEFSALSAADVDQAGLMELTSLDTPISGVLEQNIFYVNQIMQFGKFFAVFQNHPSDPGKTVVSAFMSLAIKARVLDEKRDYENVPVLRNLVPEQVLMGQSSFNSGTSISAGLPKYARNEILTVAGLLAHDAGTK